MNITFSKVDPTCFRILPIRDTEEPVDTLSTININFSALDADICNLSFSAENLWNPMYTEFTANSANWNSLYTTVHDFSACWQSTYLTVNSLSAAWLSPITVVYPFTIPKDTLNRSALVAWARINFPITQGNCVNYVNGQMLQVLTLEYVTLTQQRTCAVPPGTVSIRFIGIGTRSANCGGGTCNNTCSDRYIDTVKGISLCVEDGVWQYRSDLY